MRDRESAAASAKELARVSTQRRTMGVHSRKRPLGPNGEKICYNCSGPLPKGRPYNCSSKCSEEWSYKTSPSRLRWAVHNRDRGVCAKCRTDTDDLQKQYAALRKPHPDFPTLTKPDEEAQGAFLIEHGIPAGRITGEWWDADHIVPVIEGGGECGIENIRTLCIPCHKKATGDLAARRAKIRREELKEQRDADRGLLAGL